MSKAILVMDMPKTCYKCRLSNRLNPEELILCDGKIVSDTSTIFNLRPDWCPLRELSERKKPSKFTVSPLIEEQYSEFDRGYNACLDYLDGGVKCKKSNG